MKLGRVWMRLLWLLLVRHPSSGIGLSTIGHSSCTSWSLRVWQPSLGGPSSISTVVTGRVLIAHCPRQNSWQK